MAIKHIWIRLRVIREIKLQHLIILSIDIIKSLLSCINTTISTLNIYC